jgi:uncharacterized LabA/DUF88 family protein
LGNTKACPLAFRGLILYVNQMFDKQRIIVYVDGFNFFYGLKNLRWKKYYWLDIVKFFESFMMPQQELVAVKYFSARPLYFKKSKRQDVFFQANQENTRFKLILGKYLKKEIECFKCHNMIHTFEEKESDVRIATQIIADAYQKICDLSIIVSADSDLIPAIELAQEINHNVFIYFPPNQHSSLLSTMGKSKPIRLQKYETRFKRALLPETITLKNSGFIISKPQEWR